MRVRVHGGGVSGQAGAIRHGIARALTEIDSDLRQDLKRRGMLTQGRRRQGASQGRSEEGPQESAVLEALGPKPARKLFGTDGVRGPVGELLDARVALALGRAATEEAAGDRPQVLILRDTRESGPILEAALASGRHGSGGDACSAACCPARRVGVAPPLRLRPRAWFRPRTTRGRTTGSSSSAQAE